MWWWDLFQGLGAIVGLATGAFVLFDRSTREQPEFILTADEIVGDLLGERRLYLNVYNKSRRPLIVRVERGSGNGCLGIAKEDTVHMVVAALSRDETKVIIAGGAVERFPIIYPQNFQALSERDFIPLEIAWRFAQPIIWMPWRTCRTGMSKESLLSLLHV